MKVPSVALYSYHTYIKTPYLYRKDKEPLVCEREQLLEGEYFTEACRAYAGVGVSTVNFGYSCRLKSLFKKNKVKVLYSFYGGKLDKSKVSIEHIIPHSKGGINSQKNYVLCNTDQNFARGNAPIETYLDWKAVGLYLDQFRGVKVAGFDGDQYIKDILNSLNTALKTGR